MRVLFQTSRTSVTKYVSTLLHIRRGFELLCFELLLLISVYYFKSRKHCIVVRKNYVYMSVTRHATMFLRTN